MNKKYTDLCYHIISGTQVSPEIEGSKIDYFILFDLHVIILYAIMRSYIFVAGFNLYGTYSR